MSIQFSDANGKSCIPNRIHGTGIFTYIYTQKISTIHVGKYTSPMDAMEEGE